MVTNRIYAAVASLALAMFAVGCNPPATTTNTNGNVNTNRNTGVVVNNNAIENHNANSNREITRADFEKNRGEYESKAKQSGRKVGTGANDLWLWTKTRSALLAADDLRDSTIDVDVENDVVTLSGTVASNDQKARAEKVAHDIEGVKSVKNQLKVSASGDANNKNNNANKNTTKKG
jgi:hypothetical protein